MSSEIKDYEEEEQLQAEELEHFKGSIIVIGFIGACAVMVWLGVLGVIHG